MSDVYGWRIAVIITALPIFIVLYWRRVLPESPRWLESKGRLEEADKEMKRIEDNVEFHLGKKLPKPLVTPAIRTTEEKGNVLTLFKKRYIKRTIMLFSLWFSVIFSYYGFFTWLPNITF